MESWTKKEKIILSTWKIIKTYNIEWNKISNWIIWRIKAVFLSMSGKHNIYTLADWTIVTANKRLLIEEINELAEKWLFIIMANRWKRDLKRDDWFNPNNREKVYVKKNWTWYFTNK